MLAGSYAPTAGGVAKSWLLKLQILSPDRLGRPLSSGGERLHAATPSSATFDPTSASVAGSGSASACRITRIARERGPRLDAGASAAPAAVPRAEIVRRDPG